MTPTSYTVYRIRVDLTVLMVMLAVCVMTGLILTGAGDESIRAR
jgi:hypothetical protein